MRFDFLGVEAFLAVAERGSFHGAAERLNLSQAALSHRMKRLEHDLGVRLFLRSTRRVALTPAGLELLPKARLMIETLSDAYESLRAQGRDRPSRLVIGCLPTIATYCLPRVLKTFSDRHPGLDVHVRDVSAGEIAELVQTGEAEFGVTVVSANRWDLETKALMREPYVLLCPRRHPLARRASVGWRELEGVPLVRISARAANRAIIDDALGARREFMRWAYEAQHVATAASMVIAGLALTVVPRLAFDAANSRELAAVPIVNPAVARTVGVVTRQGVPLSRPGETLLKLITRSLGSEDRAAD